MRGYELTSLLQRDWRVRKTFRGVFPSDKLPRLPHGITHSLVVNLDTHDKPGTHWCSIFISAHGDLMYFDSFGLPPLIPDIIQFIKRQSRIFRYNTMILQNVLSSTCGLYAIYCIERMCRGDSLKCLLSKFNVYSTLYNDKLIISLYSQRLRTLSRT